MVSVRNSARERLSNGEVALGVGVRHSRNPEIARIARGAGFDWLMLDMEHNAMSIESAQQIACAALDAGIAPLIRVPEGDEAMATRLLDNGGLGTIMPHVQNAAEARRIVAAQKYPPVGHRSVGGPMVHFDYLPVPPREVIAALNAACLVVIMLETGAAIEQADEIAAVDGVDVLLIGSGDLSTDLGIPGEVSDDKMVAAHKRVIAACSKHGKWAGCGGIGPADLITRYIEMGVRFVLSGNDTGLLSSAASSRVKALRPVALT